MNANIVCPDLTLNNFRKLIAYVNDVKLSQTKFLELLPKEIVSTLIPASKGGPNKALVSALFNHNTNGKLVSERYYALRNLVTDKTHGYLDYTLFNKIKEKCETYVILEDWKNQVLDEKGTTPLARIESWFNPPGEEHTTKYSFQTTFSQLYQCYQAEPSTQALVTLLSYALLCSIFPRPQFLDGYTIPPSVIIPENYHKNLKTNTFHFHTALNRISSILDKSSFCVLIGSTGCGKESIATAYESFSASKCYYSSVHYYRASYSGIAPADSDIICPDTIDNFVNSMHTRLESSHAPALMVISDWNGKKDSFFNKLLRINTCKIIFLTTNSASKNNIPPEYCIDLDNDYRLDKRRCAQKVFVSIYGVEPADDDKRKLNELLEAVDYHFFSSVMLATALCKKRITISEMHDSFTKTSRLFERSDILPFTKNLGLDYISSSTLQFLTLLCLTPENGITKSFYHVWCPQSSLYKTDYRKSLEAYLIQEISDGSCFRLMPHIRQALMALADFSLENDIIFHSMTRLADIAKSCSDDLTNNAYVDFQDEILHFVELLLNIFPYKPGLFTNAYIQYIRFLWMVDRPKTALSYLCQMESLITERRSYFLEADLANIRLTLGYIYNSIGDFSNANRILESAASVFAKQYTSAHSLVLLTRLSLNPKSSPKHGRLLDDLDLKRKLFHSDLYQIYISQLQISRYLTRLPIEDDQKSNEEIFTAAKHYLDDCCAYFEENGQDAALATSLYTRASLLIKYSVPESRNYAAIIEDLDYAQQLRISIRGRYHSWMTSIYLAEAEIHAELQSYQTAAEYLALLDEIIRRNPEISFTEEQEKRIEKVKRALRNK